MGIKCLIFGERSLTKIAGVFASKSLAESVVARIKQDTDLEDPQIYLVGPPDGVAFGSAAFSRKLEPEQAGIWHTLIRAHVVFGVIGLIAGTLLYLAFRAADNAAIESTPGMSLFVMLFFGGIGGLLFGGLVTARPDHYRVISAVRRAVRRGRWAVVIHPITQRQIEVALRELRAQSVTVVRSL